MRIKLERFSSEDIPKLVAWSPTREFLMQWAGPGYQLETLELQLQKDMEGMSLENPTYLMFSVKDSETNETVGHIQLLNIDRSNLSARIGKVLVGGTESRGKGLGMQIIDAVLDIAFNELKLHRVDLGVFDFNKAAIACYEKAGFVKEGTFRDYRRINEEYWSLINMSILEDEYREKKNRE